MRNGQLRYDSRWKKHCRWICRKSLWIVTKNFILEKFSAFVSHQHNYPGERLEKFTEKGCIGFKFQLRALGGVPSFCLWNWMCLLTEKDCKCSSWHSDWINFRSNKQITKQWTCKSVRQIRIVGSFFDGRKTGSLYVEERKWLTCFLAYKREKLWQKEFNWSKNHWVS